MASGMKLWLAACLGGMAVAAVLLLPPRTAEQVRSQRDEGPVKLRPAADEGLRLFEEGRSLARKVLLLRVQDSLDARLAQARREGEPWFVDFHSGLEQTEEAGAFRRLWGAEVDSLTAESGRGDAVVGVVFFRRFIGSDTRMATGEKEYTFAGELADGTPYCVRVGFPPAPGAIRGFAVEWSGGTLGLCRHWARFGPPGPHVARWIEAGGYAVAQADVRQMVSVFTYPPVPFGFDAPAAAVPSLQRILASASDCLSGPDDLCAALALDTTVIGDPDFARLREVRAVTDVVAPEPDRFGATLAAPFLLSEVERLEGADALRRFWTSEAPVAEAFRQATGEDAGPWVRSWIRSLEIEPLRSTGPAMRPLTAGLSLLTLLTAFGVGLVVHGRRQVS